MRTYRFKYTKGEELKLLGYLDMMVAFQRAIKRAKLPIAFSNGFNPHQLLTFASPLSLGYTSEGEYGDLRLKEELAAEEVKERLGAQLPDGMKLLRVTAIGDEAKNTMASLVAARYRVTLPKTIAAEGFGAVLERFWAQKEILADKKTKKGMVQTNIKPLIFSLQDATKENKAAMEMVLAMGSVQSLRADAVVASLCEFCGVPFGPYDASYHRIDLYQQGQAGFVPLDEEVPLP